MTETTVKAGTRTMDKLDAGDLAFVMRRLPNDIVTMMRHNPDRLFLAGGFIRAVISGEKPSDIDLFGDSKKFLTAKAIEIVTSRRARSHVSDNAVTILSPPRLPVQLITRWTYDNPYDIIDSFDFTVCQAVIYYHTDLDAKTNKFESVISPRFYIDLANKRLVYTHPSRLEAVGGSMMRVIKYLKRGYGIQPYSLAGVMSRVMFAVRDNPLTSTEDGMTKVIAGILREIDPLMIIDGVEYVDEHELIA